MPSSTITIITFGPIDSETNAYFKRVNYIVKTLKALNYKVYVLEFPEITCEKTKYINNVTYIRLNGNKKTMSKYFKNLLTFDPLFLLRFQILSFKELLSNRSYITNSDLIIITSPLIVWGAIISKFYKKKIVMDIHEVSVVKAKNEKRKIIKLIRSISWYILEYVCLKLTDKIFTVTEIDGKLLQQIYGVENSKIYQLPLIYEYANKQIDAKELTLLNHLKEIRKKYKIIITYVGDMSVIHNFHSAQFITNVLVPYFVERNLNDIMFLIVGDGYEKLKTNTKHNNVYFTGHVNNISIIYQVSDICIAPITMSSGIAFKILEYMFFNKPIVSTRNVIEGIKGKKMNGLFTCDINDFPRVLENVIKLYKEKSITIQYELEDYHELSSIESIIYKCLNTN